MIFDSSIRVKTKKQQDIVNYIRKLISYAPYTPAIYLDNTTFKEFINIYPDIVKKMIKGVVKFEGYEIYGNNKDKSKSLSEAKKEKEQI